MNNIKKYLYIVNSPILEEGICDLEMRAIFNSEPQNKVLMSDIDFNPSDSAFIRGQLEPLYIVDTFEEILKKLDEDKLELEEFRIELIKELDTGIGYHEKLPYFNEIGERIEGIPNVKTPKIRLGLGKLDNKWIFGFYKKNDATWMEHTNKPCSYSNSLSVRVARSLVNIVTNGDKTKTIIDPCCGVGTTIVEGLSMGYDICGMDISAKNASNARQNLEFFNLEPRVKAQDMTTVEESYDCSIIDIPYGLFSHITKEQQQTIITKAKSISKKLILVTFEDLDYMVKNAGFKITDRCVVPKGKFKRYILVCE
jgi:tRNA G10  N-methylase Trm11